MMGGNDMTDFVDIEINGVSLELPVGFPLVDLGDTGSNLIPFRCKQGICGTCRIRVLQGAASLSPPCAAERNFLRRLKDNGDDIRLACQVRIFGKASLQTSANYGAGRFRAETIDQPEASKEKNHD